MKINNPTAWRVAKDFGNKTLAILAKEYGVRIVIKSAISVIEYKNTMYMISDNGGEINLTLINSDVIIASVPFTMWSTPVSPATLAFRLSERLNGKGDYEIDWNKQL